MGFFKDIAQSSFKVGDNDETIYLSKGLIRRFYVVSEPERAQQLLAYDRKVFMLLIPIITLIILFANIKEPVTLIPVILLVVIELASKKYLLRGLPVYKGKIKKVKKESADAEVFYPGLIITLAAIGLLFIGMGVAFIFLGENTGLGIALIPLLLGAVITTISLYMLKVNKSNKAVK